MRGVGQEWGGVQGQVYFGKSKDLKDNRKISEKESRSENIVYPAE